LEQLPASGTTAHTCGNCGSCKLLAQFLQQFAVSSGSTSQRTCLRDAIGEHRNTTLIFDVAITVSELVKSRSFQIENKIPSSFSGGASRNCGIDFTDDWVAQLQLVLSSRISASAASYRYRVQLQKHDLLFKFLAGSTKYSLGGRRPTPSTPPDEAA
jgi:hypothetical protein